MEPVPAAHEAFDRTPEGDYPYLGYVIRMGAVTVYHAGDTLVYDGLAERLCRLEVDIAILPDKVVITGTLHKQIFFVADDDIVHHMGEDIPFTTFVDLPGISPGDSVTFASRPPPCLRPRSLRSPPVSYVLPGQGAGRLYSGPGAGWR